MAEMSGGTYLTESRDALAKALHMRDQQRHGRLSYRNDWDALPEPDRQRYLREVDALIASGAIIDASTLANENDVPVWCSEHMEPYCPRHSTLANDASEWADRAWDDMGGSDAELLADASMSGHSAENDAPCPEAMRLLDALFDLYWNGPGSCDYGDHAGYTWAEDQALTDRAEAVEDHYTIHGCRPIPPAVTEEER